MNQHHIYINPPDADGKQAIYLADKVGGSGGLEGIIHPTHGHTFRSGYWTFTPVSPKPENATTEPMTDIITKEEQLAHFDSVFRHSALTNSARMAMMKEYLDYLSTALDLAEARGAEKYKKSLRIGFVRQWLNEDRITDPKRMVTNEEIEHMLFATSTN